MADEPTPPEENKEEGSAAEEGSAETVAAAAPASPWLPVLVVIIVLPILSLVVTEFVIIPRISKAVDEIAQIQAEDGHPATGGALPASHSKPKTEEKKSSGGHGGGEDAGVKAKDLEFKDVVANLSGSMKTRFLKVGFSVESNDPEAEAVIAENRTKIIDTTLSILSELTVEELDEAGMKNIIRNDLIDAFNHAIGQHAVDRLYFSEFVVQ